MRFFTVVAAFLMFALASAATQLTVYGPSTNCTGTPVTGTPVEITAACLTPIAAGLYSAQVIAGSPSSVVVMFNSTGCVAANQIGNITVTNVPCQAVNFAGFTGSFSISNVSSTTGTTSGTGATTGSADTATGSSTTTSAAVKESVVALLAIVAIFAALL
eukprot:TRINITY_DN18633_c0_g1_i1.p1 TRINITY_DN18633_c0_g1~~TRINITY_DN18633_c0_g1_i1.p1  ORF type:complete len:160 (-),score=85.67 TRINITY_DN18633_c0_g1_i1:40-519(-)